MRSADDTIRFLADENFDRQIVDELRRKRPLLDIQTAVEAGILGFADPLVLAHAAEHERILLSHDVHTMPGHLADFITAGANSPGVFLVPQLLPIGRAIADILLIWEASQPNEWRNLATRLPL